MKSGRHTCAANTDKRETHWMYRYGCFLGTWRSDGHMAHLSLTKNACVSLLTLQWYHGYSSQQIWKDWRCLLLAWPSLLNGQFKAMKNRPSNRDIKIKSKYYISAIFQQHWWIAIFSNIWLSQHKRVPLVTYMHWLCIIGCVVFAARFVYLQVFSVFSPAHHKSPCTTYCIVR